MKEEKFKVLLYLKKSTPDKSGKAPIIRRITVGKSMYQFSCKISYTPDLWNPRESRLNGKIRESVVTNANLDKLLLSINESYSTLMELKQPFTAEDVKNLFQGNIETQMTLLESAFIVVIYQLILVLFLSFQFQFSSLTSISKGFRLNVQTHRNGCIYSP